MSRKNGFKTFNGKSKDKKPLNYKQIFGDDEMYIDLVTGQLFNNIEQIVAELSIPRSVVKKSLKSGEVVGGYKFRKIKGGVDK